MTDLIKRSKKGDKEAFALLMDMHRQMLYNTALLVLHQEDDALDAIQDAILACWENLPTLRKDQYFKTWLVKILLNKCRDIQRSQSHYAFVEELPESGDEPDSGHSHGRGPGHGPPGRPGPVDPVPFLLRRPEYTADRRGTVHFGGRGAHPAHTEPGTL